MKYFTVRPEMRDETGWEWETVDLRMMQHSVCAVLGINL